jgi:transposase-like protein
MDKKINLYTGHRFAAEIISHAVWLYFRFTLSFRSQQLHFKLHWDLR